MAVFSRLGDCLADGYEVRRSLLGCVRVGRRRRPGTAAGCREPRAGRGAAGYDPRGGWAAAGLRVGHLLNDGAANYLPGVLPAVLVALHAPLGMAGCWSPR
ncbi:MAG: hypothetical protein ACRDQA_19865 [Nocardioidaceae bacterium]